MDKTSIKIAVRVPQITNSSKIKHQKLKRQQECKLYNLDGMKSKYCRVNAKYYAA